MRRRTDGGVAVTASQGAVTSGGDPGPSGDGSRRLARLLFAIVIAYSFVQAGVNIASQLADDRRHGGDLSWPFAALYEPSSLAGWFTMLAAIWWATGTLRPPRFTWPAALLLHAAMTLPVSIAHVAIMFAIRHGVFAIWGLDYDPGPLGDAFLYEYRKDAASYLLIALSFAAIRWVLSRSHASAPPAAASPERAMLSLSDGSVRIRAPIDEIDAIEAAGNYVEVRWRDRRILHRATLASMERQLAEAGFVRIHRSAIVRRAAIRETETLQSGDFVVTLADGAELRGSRRFRAALD